MSICSTTDKSLRQKPAQVPAPAQLPLPFSLHSHSQCKISPSWSQLQSPRWHISKQRSSFSMPNQWQLPFRQCCSHCQHHGKQLPAHNQQCLSGFSAGCRPALWPFNIPTAADCTASARVMSCWRVLHSLSLLSTLFRWCLGTPLGLEGSSSPAIPSC